MNRRGSAIAESVIDMFLDEAPRSARVNHPNVGATMFQKLGLVKPWPQTRDRDRFELTQKNEGYMVFRV